jgi:molybdopterin molybdotransferase
MITVEAALERLFALVTPLPPQDMPLRDAAGRVLARDVQARRHQPPFAASAMDGYAIRGDFTPGETLRIIGEAAAGRGFNGVVNPGETVRIFTGAPMPTGTDIVAIQEDVRRSEGQITLGPDVGPSNVRPLGADFKTGDTLAAPRRLTPSDIALLAAMNIAQVPVTRRPIVAIIATGDELVQPGEIPGPDQIIASNSYGLHALLRDLGTEPRLLPIARDTLESLAFTLNLAQGADLILTIGGASVGDHDLVGQAAGIAGMEQAFYKVAMRPGKPLMAGRMGTSMMIGLPGNPVSAMVCGHIFVAPVIRAMLGLPAQPTSRQTAVLAAPLPANGPREHYVRARHGPDGVTAFDKQDSSLLTVLSAADCLIVQPAGDGARATGEMVQIIPI